MRIGRSAGTFSLNLLASLDRFWKSLIRSASQSDGIKVKKTSGNENLASEAAVSGGQLPYTRFYNISSAV